MMTLEYAVGVLREIRGLERLEVRIKRLPAAAPEWQYALVAIDDRLRWHRYCVSLEDPQLIAAAEAWLEAERVAAETAAPEENSSRPAPIVEGDELGAEENSSRLRRPVIH